MECDCYDGEMIRDVDIDIIWARKDHICDECGKTIPRGQCYERLTGVDCDGRLTHKVCKFCQRVRNDLQDMGFCVYIGNLWEGIEQVEAEG